MASAPVITIFQPDRMCLDPTNIWLYSTPCARQEAYFISSCTVASQGDPARLTLCQPGFQRAAQYSACPEGYTEAGHWAGREGTEDADGKTTSTICCPDVYDYTHYGWAFTKSVDGGASDILFRRHPGCVATSVDVLRSLTLTVTLGNEPGLVTTTTEWADDAVLFVEAVTITQVQYRDYTAVVSTCFGGDCPARWTPTFAIPIVTPPLAQYTPPPECRDPDDLWLVTTPCYVSSPYISGTSTSWLECTVTKLGPPYVRNVSHCAQQYQTDGTQFTGCPAGYTPAALGTKWVDIDRWSRYERTRSYDVSRHVTHCCPDQYNFRVYTETSNPFNEFTTVHEGRTYGIAQRPMPACYATSVSALSGREVALQQYWDRESVTNEEGPPTTVAWDFDDATLFAQVQYVEETVFLGTHTCYDYDCHSWMAYYYGDATRPPFSATAPATTGPGQSVPDATASGTGPGPTETGGVPSGDSSAGTRQVVSWGRCWLGVISLLIVGLAL